MKTIKKTGQKFMSSVINISTFIALMFLVNGCNNANTDSSTNNQESIGNDEVVIVNEVVIVEEDVWFIDEHQINDIPVTSKAKSSKKTAPPKAQAVNKQKTEEAEAEEAADELAMEEEYEIASMEEMEASLAELDYIARHTVEVTEVAVPLDETQTVVAYNKKGKEQSEFQIISDGNGEVQQIVFTNKKHKDVYDVQAGLTGKQVKHLRKEMKHMIKKGKVFLYSDVSNVMYLMDAQNMAGDEITTADVETMEVDAIIWKDKKHHKKNQ